MTTDMLDLAHATIVNSPDIRAWPATAAITQLELRATGVHVEFSKQDTWPDVTPPGWDGPLQFTLWLFLRIGLVWYGSGIIQFWRGLAESGGAVLDGRQVALNWLYGGAWGPMSGHQPSVGEPVGFMLSAGNARQGHDDHVVAERSNVVVVPWPASPQRFDFAGDVPLEPLPPPPDDDRPIPMPDAILARLDGLVGGLAAIQADVTKLHAHVDALFGVLNGVKAPSYHGTYANGVITLQPVARPSSR